MRSKAQIASIGQETPTVRTFTLEVSREFRFLPGQWVDCYAEVEGSLQVAGYSMTSSPTRTGMIELAVKNVGDNPVTHYLHHDAEVGDTLYVEGGHGDFFFNGGVADSLVLIGGGIGLTPLMSMLSYVDEAAPEIEVLLLHSARAPEELLFRGRIEAVERRNPRVRAVFTLTGPPPKDWSGRVGRIDGAMLREVGADLGALFYVCGPPGMPENVADEAVGTGVARRRILFERWW